MMPAPVNHLESGHDTEPGDCALVALGCYLGVTYPEVIRAAARFDRQRGRDGLTIPVIKKMARSFGVALGRKRPFTWATDYGLLITPDHAAVLRNGLVLDRSTARPWKVWLIDQKRLPDECELYVVKG
jgi:hypothetical protein